MEKLHETKNTIDNAIELINLMENEINLLRTLLERTLKVSNFKEIGIDSGIIIVPDYISYDFKVKENDYTVLRRINHKDICIQSNYQRIAEKLKMLD